MARFVPTRYSLQPAGVARLAGAHHGIGRVTAMGALLFLLAAVGLLAFRAVAYLRAAAAAWAERSREREEDRKLWELALSDSRVMADLVVLHQERPRRASGYF